MRKEIKVGIFLTGALVIMAVFILVVGNLSELFRRPGYHLVVRFDTALGLDKSAAVKMAGIKVGVVKDIQLELRRARVILNIYPKYKIPRGSKVVQAVQGLLGEKYVEIQPSLENAFCNPGDELEGGGASGLDQMAPMLTTLGTEIEKVAKSVQDMIGPETRADFGQALKNIAGLTEEFRSFLAENRGQLGQTISSASETVRDVDAKVEALSTNFEAALTDLRRILEENRGDVRENVAKFKELLGKIEQSVDLLNQSLEKIQKGEGTVGKLIGDDQLYRDARGAVSDVRSMAESVRSMEARVDIRGAYHSRGDFLKSSLSIALWQRKKSFFLGQVVHQPEEDRFSYSAQGGIRWKNFAPRGGIIESEFGAGLDYYALRDRVVLSLEGLDFNRAVSPLWRAFARFFPRKNVYLILGLEDFSLSANREVFFGLGVGL